MITDKIKLDLISLIEKNVVAILIANGYVSHLGGELSWDKIIVNDETINLLKSVKENFIDDDKLIEELMSIYPKEQLDSKKALLQRWTQFKKKTELLDITHNEVIEAAEKHIKDMGPKYCGNLFYFFFKEENKVYKSRLEKNILLIRDADKFTKTLEASNDEINWDVKVI